MNWFILALGCALSETVKDITSKRAFRSLDEYVCAFSTAFFALPWLAICVYFESSQQPGLETILLASLAASLHIAAFLLYFRAIRTADLSLVLPLISFTPLFYLVTSPVMIGEYPGPWGIVGVLLIVLGSYLLNLDARTHGVFAPFIFLLKSAGARSMLGTAIIWSITGNIDKMGIAHCPLFTWFFIVISFMSFGLAVIALRYSTITPRTLWRHKFSLCTLGFFHASSSLFYVLAISSTLVAYVVSVKRLSVVLGVLWGGMMLKESGMYVRLPATICMLLGVLCISLSS